MRIALVTNNFTPIVSGVTTSILTLYAELTDFGHKVYIVAPNYPGYSDVDESIIRVRSIPLYYRANYPLPIFCGKELASIFNQLKIDLVHSHHPFGLGQSALIACKKYNNIPLVFTHHTLYEEYLHYIPAVMRKIARLYVNSTVMKYMYNCDSIIVPNNKMKDNFISKKILKKVTCIPTGISRTISNRINDHDINNFPQLKNISKKDSLFLCVSRVTEEKNILFLLRTLPFFVSKKKNFKIILAGDGHLFKKIKKNINKKYNKYIIFLGEVSHDNMSAIYNMSDLLLFVSKTDTQGLPLIESLPFGLPIVAVNSLASDEFVKINNTGITTPEIPEYFAESSINLINSAGKMNFFHSNNISLVKKFSSKKYGLRIQNLYNCLY